MTELEALQMQLTQVNAKLDEIMSVSSKKIIKRAFYECLDEWFLTVKAPNLCAGSIRSLRNVVRLLKQYIPNKQVYELRPVDFEQAFNSLPATKTRKDMYVYSREFLKWAYYNKFVAEDISIFLKQVKYKAKEGVAYSQKQVKQIFKHIKNANVLALFKFYYLTGVRRSEALSLRWRDIDTKHNVIHICGTKTASSNRYIPITKQVANLLESLPYTFAEDTVFKVTYASIRWEVERLKRLLSFNVNIKNFRTTFATRCADIGIAPKVVQSWLGHTDIRVTNKYYIKATPYLNSQEVALFNNKY